MSNTLFNRKVRLILAFPIAEDFKTITAQTLVIEDLRVQFKVTKTLDQNPNSAEITVTNLSQKTRGALPSMGAKVILEAGYETTVSRIFVGDARLIESKRQGADWETKIECGDGERGLKFARVSESFNLGAKVSSVIKTIGQATGLQTGNLAEIASGANSKVEYVQGYAAHGSAARELDRVLKANGFEWSVQDGALQILTVGGVTTEPVIFLDQSSGLVGSPEFGTAHKKDGKPFLKVKSLLQPQFKPGGRCHVKSVVHDALFRIEKVEHTGDTKGGSWYSDLEVSAT